MGNLRRRVERLGGGSEKERRAYCKAWAKFLTENGEPMTAEEMDAEIPALNVDPCLQWLPFSVHKHPIKEKPLPTFHPRFFQ